MHLREVPCFSIFWACLLIGLAKGLTLIQPTTNLNIREGPGTGFSIVWTASSSEEFEKLGENGDASWFNIKSQIDGREGWASASFLERTWVTTAGPNAVEKLDRTGRRSEIPHQRTVTKFLLHTIEGRYPNNGDFEGGTSTLDSKGFWPHFIVARDQSGAMRMAQYLPLSVGGYALRGNNRDGVIQVELGSKAGMPFTEVDPTITAAVKFLYAELQDAISIPNQVGAPMWLDSQGYGVDAPSRLSDAEFKAAEGLVGHSHAPIDSHWDPGAIDPTKLLISASPGGSGFCPSFGAECPFSETETDGSCQRMCTSTGSCSCASEDDSCCSGTCSASGPWSCSSANLCPTTNLNIRSSPTTSGSNIVFVANPSNAFLHVDVSVDQNWFKLVSVGGLGSGYDLWAYKTYLTQCTPGATANPTDSPTLKPTAEPTASSCNHEGLEGTCSGSCDGHLYSTIECSNCCVDLITCDVGFCVDDRIAEFCDSASYQTGLCPGGVNIRCCEATAAPTVLPTGSPVATDNPTSTPFCGSIGEACNSSFSSFEGACFRECETSFSTCSCIGPETCCIASDQSTTCNTLCSSTVKFCALGNNFKLLEEPNLSSAGVFSSDPKLPMVHKGVSANGNWYRMGVEFEGLNLQGWIPFELVSFCDDEEPFDSSRNTTHFAFAVGEELCTPSGQLPVAQDTPNEDAASLQRLESGFKPRYVSSVDDFVQITRDPEHRRTGWAPRGIFVACASMKDPDEPEGNTILIAAIASVVAVILASATAVFIVRKRRSNQARTIPTEMGNSKVFLDHEMRQDVTTFNPRYA